MFNTKIKLFEQKFTKTEQRIADYILENQNEVRLMTSRSLADILNIGQSNIVRFSQKIGYKGFRDLQVNINVNSESVINDINETDSTMVTNGKIVDQYIEIVKLTNSLNDHIKIDDAVNRIISARKIIVCGIGNSGLFASYLSNHLLKMGLVAINSTNTHIIYTAISNCSAKDLVIVITETGETREIIKMAKISNNKKVPVIAITRMFNSKVSQLSDLILKTSNDLSNSRLNAMTIRCSQLCIIDMLCLNVLKKNYSKFKKTTLESEKLLDDNYFSF